MTTEIGFYHCTRSAPSTVLPTLVAKAYGAGYKVAVHCADAGALASADSLLWTYDPASFLPHGVENGARQPILVTRGFDVENGADLMICTGGQLPGNFADFKRVLYIFDGSDTQAVETARGHWRGLAARENVAPVYWMQGEGGGWQNPDAAAR